MTPAHSQQPARTGFALGLMGLGALSLVYRDFALVWQPVPDGIPGRTALACAAGVVEILFALGLLFRPTAPRTVRILFPYLIVWQMLKLPELFLAPQMEGSWLGFGELAILFAAGLTLFACLADLPAGSRFAFLTGDRAVRFACLYLGFWIIPIGISHFVYVQATIHLVPPWLPYRMGWAYLTGAGQIASGLGLLFNVLPRIAAWAEAAQISLYTLLIWLPALFHPNTPDMAAVFQPTDLHMVATAFFISWFMACGAWVIAQNTPGRGVSSTLPS